MTTILAALATGLLVGLIFTALKLPLPAPAVWSGVAGIVGILLGSKIWEGVIAPWLGRFFG
ncbi:MAG: XapX domain-containing protein [Akkermansiaceae bacterium]